MYGYIYKNTCLVNGKIYIGLHKYLGEGLDEAYWGSGPWFSNALSKYGEDNWTREIIDTAESLEELSEKEIYWISKYYPNGVPDESIGYNQVPGGYLNDFAGPSPGFKHYTNGKNDIHLYDGEIVPDDYYLGSCYFGENNPFYGKHHTDETKKLISEKCSQLTHSDESKKKISNASTIHWQDPIYRNKVITGLKNTFSTSESKEKLSARSSGKNNSMSRTVICIETGQIFDTVGDAVKWLSSTTGHGGAVGRSCKNGTATMGYHFKYCDNKNPNYASGRTYNYKRPKEVSNKVGKSLSLYHKEKRNTKEVM